MKSLIFLAAGALAFAQNNQAQNTQRSFDTPEAAAEALIHAAAGNDTAALNAIFGPQGRSGLTSGDPAQDKAEQQEFAKIAQTKHELQKDSMNPNRMILSVGNQDWPFPVPIVKKNNGWVFDSSMGALAMKARKIGANELSAIETCSGLAGAELQYAQTHSTHNYAANIAELTSLVPKDFMEAESGTAPEAYHGYRFQILRSQGPDAPGGAHNYAVKNALMGGFAIVAWPAQYGVTGVNTFIVNQDGVVYEKDLGPHTTAPVSTYNPDASWRPVY
jgi:hypothetical protein